MIGVALLGSLVAARGAFLGGLQTGLAVAAGAFVLGAVLTVVFVS